MYALYLARVSEWRPGDLWQSPSNHDIYLKEDPREYLCNGHPYVVDDDYITIARKGWNQDDGT